MKKPSLESDHWHNQLYINTTQSTSVQPPLTTKGSLGYHSRAFPKPIKKCQELLFGPFYMEIIFSTSVSLRPSLKDYVGVAKAEFDSTYGKQNWSILFHLITNTV